MPGKPRSVSAYIPTKTELAETVLLEIWAHLGPFRSNSEVFGPPAHFWRNLESNYREQRRKFTDA